ncbi:hypothetical protein L0F63_007408, partial [Massospora cicadina]
MRADDSSRRKKRIDLLQPKKTNDCGTRGKPNFMENHLNEIDEHPKKRRRPDPSGRSRRASRKPQREPMTKSTLQDGVRQSGGEAAIFKPNAERYGLPVNAATTEMEPAKHGTRYQTKLREKEAEEEAKRLEKEIEK